MPHLCRALFVISVVLSPARLGAEEPAPLPQKLVEKLDNAVQAYRGGHVGETLKQLQPVLEALGPEQMEAARRHIEVVHRLDLTVPELVTRARVQLVAQGEGGRLRKPGTVELPLALVALDEQIGKLAEAGEREVNTGFPAVVPGPVIEDRLALIPNLLTQLGQAELLVNHMERLTKRMRPAALEKLNEQAKAIAGRNFDDDHKKLNDLAAHLVGRQVDFAMLHLTNAVQVLADERQRFEERFTAAGRAVASGAIITSRWEQYTRWRQRTPVGLDPTAEARWRTQLSQVGRWAGPLLVKVFHYNEATKWWLRGRFGLGPLGGGLAKNIPLQLPKGNLARNRAALALLDTPIYMPHPIPKPEDPNSSLAISYFPRRHLEWWQLETRIVLPKWVADLYFISLPPDVHEGLYASLLDDGRDRKLYREQRMRFRPVQIELGQEDYRLGRLVGYLEYLAALSHFERLLAITTPAEQRALDEMIADDDRFVVYSNLSRKYDRLDPTSSLRIARRTNDPRATEPFERRGLAWVMALARVELGAMRAGHTGETRSEARRTLYAIRTQTRGLIENPYGPFEKWPPTSVDREAFLEILWDGAREHYYHASARLPAVGGNEFVHRVTLLQLDRKLRVAIEMIAAFRFFAAASLTVDQRGELDRWLTEVEQQYALVQGALDPPLDPTRINAVRNQEREAAKKTEADKNK